MTPSPDVVLERLRRASALSNLCADRRLDAKLDSLPRAVMARLREASALLDACRALEKLGADHSTKANRPTE
jgi:hypothetical protein